VNFASQLDLSERLRRTLAAADFDNDQKLDGAVLVDCGRIHSQNTFRIDIHLSGSSNSELIFESAEIELAIGASDVNEDGATDVVVEQTSSHQRLYLWLNDGHGDFHRGRIEDFQSNSNPSGERFEMVSSGPDWTTAWFAPQRGIETDKMATRSLFMPRPSSNEFSISSGNSSPTSLALSTDFSRAPPFSL